MLLHVGDVHFSGARVKGIGPTSVTPIPVVGKVPAIAWVTCNDVLVQPFAKKKHRRR